MSDEYLQTTPNSLPAPAEGLRLMREPFPAHQVSKLCRSTKKDNPKGRCDVCGGWHGLPAISLDYVGHAALTDRLLQVDELWDWEPLALGADGLPAFDKINGLWIKLTVCGKTRLGYGHAEGKTGGDAIKEIIGDALRNAAMRFGAALDLWHKGELHAPPVDEGDGKKGKKAASTRDGMQIQDMPEERQIVIREHYGVINDACEEGNYQSAANLWHDCKLPTEEKAALWFLLASHHRSAIKRVTKR